MIHIERLTSARRAWANELLIERWGSINMIVRDEPYDLSRADGFVALFDGEDAPIGLATYAVRGAVCELLSLDSTRPGQGAGGALVASVADAARALGCRRLQLITTNDNTEAMRFYQTHGFELSGINLNAIDRARALKPEIPLRGLHGIALRHEIEFSMTL